MFIPAGHDLKIQTPIIPKHEPLVLWFGLPDLNLSQRHIFHLTVYIIAFDRIVHGRVHGNRVD
jgi:hypothetical protein